MDFIVFNTLAQAENFVKRQPDFDETHSCGCCSTTRQTIIDDDRVVEIVWENVRGDVEIHTNVLGRIKKA